MTEHNLPVPDDAPWLNLSQNEIQELRKQKHEITEYAKEKLRKLIYEQDMKKMEEAAKDLVLNNLTHEEMIEEAARRERSNRILERYNNFYNLECSGLSWGTPITPEFQQAMTLECVLDTLRCENLNHEFDMVPTADINDLIEALYQQGKDYLERVRTVQEQAQGKTKTDLDAL
jgi:hypothetical protein